MSTLGTPKISSVRLTKALLKKRALTDVIEVDSNCVRGVSVSNLMASRAQVLRKHGLAAREEPFQTYKLSKPTERLSYFLSHAWVSPRYEKYFSLLCFFNMEPAVCVSCCVIACCCIFELMFFDKLPSWCIQEQVALPDGEIIALPILCETLGVGTFLIILFTAHRFNLGTKVFLDIACIPQDDGADKAQGIESLGALLDRSERMLVLMDAYYWTRLWCTFEIAAFCHRSYTSKTRLVFLHLNTAMLQASIIILCWTGRLVSFFPFGLLAHRACWLVLLLPAHILIFMSMDDGWKSREAIDSLRDFQVDQTKCFSTEDREAILDVIAEWFTDRRSEIYIAERQDKERLRRLGLHCFEHFVRYELVQYVEDHVAAVHGGVLRGTLLPTPTVFQLAYCCLIPHFCDYVSSPRVNLWMAGRALVIVTWLVAVAYNLWTLGLALVLSCYKWCCKHRCPHWLCQPIAVFVQTFVTITLVSLTNLLALRDDAFADMLNVVNEFAQAIDPAVTRCLKLYVLVLISSVVVCVVLYHARSAPVRS